MFNASGFNIKKPAFLTETLPHLKDQLKSTFSQPILASLHSIKRKTQQFQDEQQLIFLQVGTKVWEGVPRNMRSELWLSILQRKDTGVGEAMDKYEDMLASDVKPITATDIDKDVPRTFPNTKKFHSQEGQNALRRVLRAYAAFDPEVGYCQGMNFLAGLLLLYLTEEQAFGALVLIMFERGFRLLYQHNMSLLQIQLWQLGQLMPYKLRAHLESCGVVPVLFAAPWLMTCYSADFPISFSSRVLDMVLTNCMISPLLRVAVVLLKRCEKKLRTMPDMEDVLMYLKSEVPAWDEAELHTILTDAFNKDWHERHKAVLGNTDGVETIAQAMARVHVAPEERGQDETPILCTVISYGGTSESEVGHPDAGAALPDALPERPQISVRVSAAGDGQEEPALCHGALDTQMDGLMHSPGSQSNSCFSFSDIERMSQSAHSPTQSEQSPSSPHSPESNFWDPYLNDLRLFTLGELTELRNLSFNKTPRHTDHSGRGLSKGLVRSHSASASVHCSMEAYLGSDDDEDDAVFFEVASRSGSISSVRSLFHSRSINRCGDAGAPMSPASVLSSPQARTHKARQERSNLGTGFGSSEDLSHLVEQQEELQAQADQPEDFASRRLTASILANYAAGSPRSEGSAPIHHLGMDLSRFLATKPSFSCMSESEVLHSRAFPSVASLAMSIAAGTAVAEAIAMSRAANVSVTSSMCESEASMFTARETSMMSTHSQPGSAAGAGSSDVSPAGASPAFTASLMLGRLEAIASFSAAESESLTGESPESLLDQLLAASDTGLLGESLSENMQPLPGSNLESPAKSSDGQSSDCSESAETSFPVLSSRMVGQPSRLSRVAIDWPVTGSSPTAATQQSNSDMLTMEYGTNLNSRMEDMPAAVEGDILAAVHDNMLTAVNDDMAAATMDDSLVATNNMQHSNMLTVLTVNSPAAADGYRSSAVIDNMSNLPLVMGEDDLHPATNGWGEDDLHPATNGWMGNGSSLLDTFASHPIRSPNLLMTSSDDSPHAATTGSDGSLTPVQPTIEAPSSPDFVLQTSLTSTLHPLLNAGDSLNPALATGSPSPQLLTLPCTAIDSSPTQILPSCQSSGSANAVISPSNTQLPNLPASPSPPESTPAPSAAVAAVLSPQEWLSQSRAALSTSASQVSAADRASTSRPTDFSDIDVGLPPAAAPVPMRLRHLSPASSPATSICNETTSLSSSSPTAPTQTKSATGEDAKQLVDSMPPASPDGSTGSALNQPSGLACQVPTATSTVPVPMVSRCVSSSGNSTPGASPQLSPCLASSLLAAGMAPDISTQAGATDTATQSITGASTIAVTEASSNAWGLLASSTRADSQQAQGVTVPGACHHSTPAELPIPSASTDEFPSAAMAVGSAPTPLMQPISQSSLVKPTSLSNMDVTGGLLHRHSSSLPHSPTNRATMSPGQSSVTAGLGFPSHASSINPTPLDSYLAASFVNSRCSSSCVNSLSVSIPDNQKLRPTGSSVMEPASTPPLISSVSHRLSNNSITDSPKALRHMGNVPEMDGFARLASERLSALPSNSQYGFATPSASQPTSIAPTRTSTMSIAQSLPTQPGSLCSTPVMPHSPRYSSTSGIPILSSSMPQCSLSNTAVASTSGMPLGDCASPLSIDDMTNASTPGLPRCTLETQSSGFIALPASMRPSRSMRATLEADSQPVSRQGSLLPNLPIPFTRQPSRRGSMEQNVRASPCMSTDVTPGTALASLVTAALMSTSDPPESTVPLKAPTRLAQGCDSAVSPRSPSTTTGIVSGDKSAASPAASLPSNLSNSPDVYWQAQSSSAAATSVYEEQTSCSVAVGIDARQMPVSPCIPAPSAALNVASPTFGCDDESLPTPSPHIGSYGWLHTERPFVSALNGSNHMYMWPRPAARPCQPITPSITPTAVLGFDNSNTTTGSAVDIASSRSTFNPVESTPKASDPDDWLSLASPATVCASAEGYGTANQGDGWDDVERSGVSISTSSSHGSHLKRQVSGDPSNSPSHTYIAQNNSSQQSINNQLTLLSGTEQPISGLSSAAHVGIPPLTTSTNELHSTPVTSHPLQSSLHSSMSSKQDSTPGSATKPMHTPFMPTVSDGEAAAATAPSCAAAYEPPEQFCTTSASPAADSIDPSQPTEQDTHNNKRQSWNHVLHVSVSTSPVHETIFNMSPGRTIDSPDPTVSSTNLDSADILLSAPYLQGAETTPRDSPSPQQGQWYTNAPPVVPEPPGSPTIASSFQSIDSFILVSPPAYGSIRNLSGRAGSPGRDWGPGGAAMFAALHARHRPKKSLDSQILDQLNGFQANCGPTAPYPPASIMDPNAKKQKPAPAPTSWQAAQTASVASAENVDVLNERLSAYLSEVTEVL